MLNTNPNLIYSTTLDDKYIVKVERTGDYTAILIVMEGDKELLREDTTLAYRAPFGPDVSDVATWQARAIKFVDEELPTR